MTERNVGQFAVLRGACCTVSLGLEVLSLAARRRRADWRFKLPNIKIHQCVDSDVAWIISNNNDSSCASSVSNVSAGAAGGPVATIETVPASVVECAGWLPGTV